MKVVFDENDSKLLTKWKNSWLTKTSKDTIILKDIEKMEKSWALLHIYRAYAEKLKENSLIDFSDMILRAGNLLETDETVRMSLAEQYQWILMDEYQDTNGAQLALVTHIAGVTDEPNIFAVGDDDQSIFKFQGANIKNLEYFKNHFPDTKLVILEENYRSHSEIINFSRSVISNTTRLQELFPEAEKKFIAARGDGGYIEKWQFESEILEISWVAEKIQEIIQTE